MTDKITFSTFLELLRKTLGNYNCTVFVCYGNTIIPPEDVRDEIIKENQDSLVGGHSGITKTYRRIRENLFWSRLKEDYRI